METVTESLTRWLMEAPGMEGLRTEIMQDKPESCSLSLVGSRELSRSRDITGRITRHIRWDYTLRLALPLNSMDDALAIKNRARLEALYSWAEEKSLEAPPECIGPEDSLKITCPTLQDLREGMGIYGASVTLTTTNETEEKA